MSELWDQLLTGTITRRKFIERVSAAGAALPLLGCELAAAPLQGDPKGKAGGSRSKPNEDVVYSPANIGGGGRIERNFYRDWIKSSKVPMVEGYAILDAQHQEVQPWPEIGGRGLYLNFSGNVHMDAVIIEIPEGKALTPRRHFYEQVVY